MSPWLVTIDVWHCCYDERNKWRWKIHGYRYIKNAAVREIHVDSSDRTPYGDTQSALRAARREIRNLGLVERKAKAGKVS